MGQEQDPPTQYLAPGNLGYALPWGFVLALWSQDGHHSVLPSATLKVGQGRTAARKVPREQAVLACLWASAL
jgi:hypothetical protein